MSIRLNKATRDFNVGLSSIVEFLHKKGFSVEENPNTKISDEAYELLLKEFSKDKDLKLESTKIGKQQRPKEAITTEIFNPGIVAIEPNIKVIGHIDLNTINQLTRPEKKSPEKKNKRKRLGQGKINVFGEKDPLFIGDIPAFKKWINSQYSDVLDPYITEDVVVIEVNFNVDAQGHVKDVKALNAKHPELAAEAVRIISLSPDWIPGIKTGIPTEMPQLFYLKFNRLEDDDNG
jgi:hypothetical protein